MKNQSKIENIRAKKQKTREIQSKSELGLNQILKPALFFAISVILEIVSFIALGFKDAHGATQIFPTYIFFDIGFWLIVSGLLICTHKNWISNTLFYFFVAVQVAFFITNLTLRNDFGYLFTFDKLRLLPEMIAAMDLSFINFKLIFISVLGLGIVIAIPLVFDKLLKNKKVTIKKVTRPIFCLLCFMIAATVGSGTYAAQSMLMKTSAYNTEISDDKYLFQNQNIKDLSYQRFGSCGFYLKSLSDLIFGKENYSQAQKEQMLNTYNSSTATENTSAVLYGDNLIMIMLESFEWFAIDPYNTPNLWALKTGTSGTEVPGQAQVFTNYHSNNKTNISEDLAILGYMPNESTFVASNKNAISTKYSIPNLLKSQNYQTSFFHNWKSSFYNRGKTMSNLGYDNCYFVEDFENENKSTRFNFYNLESDFIDQFISQMAPTDKSFMSFYTTVSSHGTYTTINPRFEKYFDVYDSNIENLKSWFETEGYNYPADKKYQAILKEYKCAAMDTDEMIGKLFKHLNDTGLINNTTVVVYADHNAFYHDLTYKIKGTKRHDYSNQKSYTVPLMIYSQKLTPSNIDTFCSTYDLYPTLATLFGLPYNTLCAQGKDIFSSEISETIYVSYLTGFYSDKCYSKEMLKIKKYDGAADEDEALFKERVCKFFKNQKILDFIYHSKLTY